MPHLRVDAHQWKVALHKETVQLNRTLHLRYENDHLVEVKSIEKIIELAVFLLLLQFDEVLHKTVQGKLGVAVNEDLKRLRFVGVFER